MFEIKRITGLFMAAVLICLCGCTQTPPLNETLSTVPAAVSIVESTSAITEKETEAKNEKTTVTPTEADKTEAPTTIRQTTAAPTTKKPEPVTTQKPSTTATEETEEQTTEKDGNGLLDNIIEGITEISSILSPEDKDDSIDADKPMLALTFDDGPSAHTERLLDIFKEHGGKGTFFVVGNIIDRRSEVLKRMAKEGHEIGNHSWSHADLTDLDSSGIRSELDKTSDKIRKITGKKCKIARPPYGAHNSTVKQVGAELGLAYITWSVDTLDWKTKNAQAVYDSVMGSASDGAIILCHDLHKTTVDAMERVIPALIDEGYQLVTVTELLTANGSSLQAGKIYSRQK